jgi:hypothetical protein
MTAPQRMFLDGDDLDRLRPYITFGTTPKCGVNGKPFSLTRRFCAMINRNTPVFLPFTDMNLSGQGLGKGYCHANVEFLVRHCGGSAQFGWLIWQDGKAVLDAEFHCCWRTPEDELLDVSPRVANEPLALFLPDHVRKFDWDTMTTYNNRFWDRANAVVGGSAGRGFGLSRETTSTSGVVVSAAIGGDLVGMSRIKVGSGYSRGFA